MSDDEEKDLEAYRLYIQLWKDENPIKTNKLQVLLLVNGLLVSALQVAGGFQATNWLLFLAGFIFSFIWILSIGRTSLFQKVWHIKANEIARKYPGDQRFLILETDSAEKNSPAYLRVLGCVSSKHYLLGAPLLFAFFWFIALFYILAVNPM